MERSYKVSKYNLYRYNYVYNLRQRSLLRVNDSILKALQNNELENIPPQVMKLLLTAGIVVEGIDEVKLLEFWLSLKSFNTNSLSVAYIPNYHCNFRCTYCYAQSVRDIKRQESENVNADFLKWIENLFALAEPRSFEITFHGGEPLLSKQEILFLCKSITELCQKHSVRLKDISFVTNGSLLDKGFVEEVLRLGITCRALVTLDGTENIHNRRRFDIKGKGTFSLIVDNVILALNLGMFVTVGFNYDRQNYTDIPYFLDFLVEKGFDKRPNFQLIFGAVRKGLDQESVEHFKKFEMGQVESAKVLMWAYGSIYEPLELLMQRSADFVLPYHWEKYPLCKECVYLPVCLGGCFEQAFIRKKKFYCRKRYFENLLPDLIDLTVRLYGEHPKLTQGQKLEHIFGIEQI
ncbi:MAG: radical SAM protein [candidate division WOR-3 bacterium]